MDKQRELRRILTELTQAWSAHAQALKEADAKKWARPFESDWRLYKKCAAQIEEALQLTDENEPPLGPAVLTNDKLGFRPFYAFHPGATILESVVDLWGASKGCSYEETQSLWDALMCNGALKEKDIELLHRFLGVSMGYLHRMQENWDGYRRAPRRPPPPNALVEVTALRFKREDSISYEVLEEYLWFENPEAELSGPNERSQDVCLFRFRAVGESRDSEVSSGVEHVAQRDGWYNLCMPYINDLKAEALTRMGAYNCVRFLTLWEHSEWREGIEEPEYFENTELIGVLDLADLPYEPLMRAAHDEEDSDDDEEDC